jgi:uncharacterized membrane protein YkoI
MKTLQWWALGAAIGLAIVAGSGLIVLAGDDKAALAARLSKSGEILPLEQILERAQAEHPGKLLETELDHEWDRYVYEIKILDNKGIVWKMEFDAKTGAFIRSKQKKEDD